MVIEIKPMAYFSMFSGSSVVLKQITLNVTKSFKKRYEHVLVFLLQKELVLSRFFFVPTLNGHKFEPQSVSETVKMSVLC